MVVRGRMMAPQLPLIFSLLVGCAGDPCRRAEVKYCSVCWEYEEWGSRGSCLSDIDEEFGDPPGSRLTCADDEERTAAVCKLKLVEDWCFSGVRWGVDQGFYQEEVAERYELAFDECMQGE